MEKSISRLITAEELKPASVAEVIAQPSFADKLQQCKSLFGAEFWQLDQAIQDAVIMRRLQQLVNTLKLNPLWKIRLNNCAIQETPENYAEWQRLPITDRETLNEFYMADRPGQVVPLTHGGFEIIASGGTSGGLPIETVYSLDELHDTYKIAGHFIGTFVLPHYLKGDQPKWVITTLSDYEMWSSGTMIGGVLQQTPNVNFVAAGPMGKMVYNHVMSFAGPKAVMGMSREIEGLIPLGESLSEEARESFRLAIYGSGVLQSRKENELRRLYPNLEILSYFASNQAEAIGMQLKPDAYLTTVPGLHLIEIVDDKGHWVDIGEEGELVITRLHAKEAPILRMKLGDRMIRRPDLKTDQLVAQQLEFAGRSSDILHLGESHYSLSKVYQDLCRRLKDAAIIDIERQAHEVQFTNNRKQKSLTFLASIDDAAAQAEKIRLRANPAQIKGYFIEALKSSLSLFDQTDAQYHALDRTAYQFHIRLVEKGSPEIYRTRVNKVPLIRDIL